MSATALSPANAEEHGGGLLGAISELFKRPGDAPVDVPKRRKSARPSQSEAPVRAREPSEPPSPEPASVDAPERREAEGPTPAPAPVDVPKRRDRARLSPSAPRVEAPERPEAGGLAPTWAPIDVPKRLEGVHASHVFRAVRDLIAEIEILREELRVEDYPPVAELPDSRAPIHLYAKSLEVLAKVTATQQRLGVPAGAVGQIPLEEIHAGDVLANIEYILIEVRKLKSLMRIGREIETAPLEIGKTSSLIYKGLADASFMLDGLRGGPLSPDDVYRTAWSVLEEMALIAEKLEVPLDLEVVPTTESRKPIDVALALARAAFKVADLQTKLRMDASGVPRPILLRATPSKNHDATSMLLAEMVRIKLHLGIGALREERPVQRQGKTPSDVCALVMLIVRNLDRLALAASG